MPKLLTVEHFRQEHPVGCLAACVQMAMHFHGVAIAQSRLNRVLGLTSVGVPASRVRRLNQLDLEITYGASDEIELRHCLDNGAPPIAFVQTGDLPYWKTNVAHAVVVVGYDEHNVFLNDPAFADAPQTVTWGDFLLAWSEFDYRHVTVKPKS